MLKKFNTFYFEDFEWNATTKIARFGYSFDHTSYFYEEIDFAAQGFYVRDDLDNEILRALLFHCHIALGVSYYKLYPTQKLIVWSGQLDDQQSIFWKKFYSNGLAEFLIRNDIDPSGLFQFTSNAQESYEPQHFSVQQKALLPWGGGKDSIVSSLLLDKQGTVPYNPYVVGKIDTIKQETGGVLGKDILQVTRALSPALFDCNAQGYYNGHVPITGVIAFLSIVTAYLYDYKYVILSNEFSASEPNTYWKGLDINHQYSKSFEFEQDFSAYVSRYMTQDISYFSLLRGMHEYKIAEIFCIQAQDYFSCFSSCNKNFVITSSVNHTGRWCQSCEKCCFVYLMLSAFLDHSQLIEIFGVDLFENKSLESTFLGLIGHQADKPFECVGTYEESLFACSQAIAIRKDRLPYILSQLEIIVQKKLKNIGVKKLKEKLETISDDDIIPSYIKTQTILGY